jgi:predicted patatin/cPLA2 family phospholipase
LIKRQQKEFDKLQLFFNGLEDKNKDYRDLQKFFVKLKNKKEEKIIDEDKTY